MTVRERIVAAARALIGTPYVWGGNDPDRDGGVDCSGFVLHVWRAEGLDLADMTAQGLRERCEPMEAADTQPGDVAFYGRGERATHVVLVTEPGGAEIIGANGGGRVYRPGAHACVRVEARGVRYRRDLLGCGRFPGRG